MWQKLLRILRSSFGIISVIMVIGLWSTFSYYVISYFAGPAETEGADYFEPSDSDSTDSADCNVTGINLHGELFTYPPSDSEDSYMGEKVVSADMVTYYLKEAERNENVKAIILEIDSYGGAPVAGEEIADVLKSINKPTVALIRQAGTSAAYWAATGAKKIFASKNSDVGSLGVTMSYLENIEKNQNEGLGFIQLSVGKFKDMGNPDKPLTAEEKTLIYRDLNIIHQNFIEAVSVNRQIPLADVQKIADGSSVLGERAKSLKLIDEIGSLADVEKYLSDLLGEKAEICWY